MYRLIHSGHTGEHPLLVTDEGPLRSLRFGTEERQSCIDITAPEKLQLAYTRWMTTALLFHPLPERFLLFGLGGGALPHFLLHHYPGGHIHVVEKEEAVIRVAHEHFLLPRGKPLHIFHADARGFLSQRPPGGYHIAFLDIYGPGTMAPDLYSTELYTLVLEQLAETGVLAINLWNGNKTLYNQAVEAVSLACAGRLLQLQVKKRSNTILLAFPTAYQLGSLKQLRKDAPFFHQRYGINYPKYLKQLRRTNPRTIMNELLAHLQRA